MEGCASGPSASRCGFTEGSRGRGQPEHCLGKAAVRDTRMSGKGRVGETRRPSARKELPLSGKDPDARFHPLPLPCALHSCFGQPQSDSLEGTGGGDFDLILIRGMRCWLGTGRHLASLGPEPVCLARTPSQRPHQPSQEAFWCSFNIIENSRKLDPAPHCQAKFCQRHQWLVHSLIHSFITFLWLKIPVPHPSLSLLGKRLGGASRWQSCLQPASGLRAP